MMQPTSLFRFLIVMSIVLAVCGALIDGVFPNLLPEQFRQAQEAMVSADFRAQDLLLFIVGPPIFVAAIVSTVALYRFRPWAPRLALYVTIGGIAIYPILDAQVMSSWSMLLTETSVLLWGVVLAMSFLPPVGEKFRRLHANNSTQPTGQEPPAAN